MKPALFSISYAGFWGQATLKLIDFIEHAGKLGYPAVMIAGKRPHLSPLDANDEFLQPIQAALQRANVSCAVLAAYTNLGQTSHVGCEVPLIEFQISYVEALAKVASLLGAKVVRIFTAYAAFFTGLQEGGFQGISTYEMCSPIRGGGELENLDRCARRFLEWNREKEFISIGQ